MPVQPIYNTGTITVVAGSQNVTGTGTAWEMALVNGGTLSFKGFAVPIIAVGSDTSIAIAYAAPAAMAGTGTYAIELGRADAASTIVANRQLADLTDLLRNKVSPFAATFLDDLTAAAVRQTIGAASPGDIPPEITAAAVLAKLLTVDTDTAGINATTLKSVTPGALGLALLDGATLDEARSTLGMSPFIKTIQAIANGPAFTSAIGAQPALGFTSVQQGTGVGQLTNAIKIGWNNAFPKMTVDTTDLGRIWTDFEGDRSLSTSIIRQKLPGGLIFQAGLAGTGASDRAITYPLSFDNVAFPFAIPWTAGTAAVNWSTSYVVGYNKNNFTLANRTGGGATIVCANFWFAIGF